MWALNSFFERFVLSFSLKIERFVSDSAEIWICGLYVREGYFCRPVFLHIGKGVRGNVLL